jgi:ribose transport system permease protein
MQSGVLGRIKNSDFSLGVIDYFKRNFGIMVGLLLLCVVIAIRSPMFFTQRNLMNVLRQISSNMYLATSMTFILIAGGIDLSVGSGLAVTGVFTAQMLLWGFSVPIAVIAGLLIGVVIGAISGLLISRTTLPPFIVTFAMMSILRGTAYVATGGITIRVDNQTFVNLGVGYLGIVPLPVVYMIVIILGAWFVLNRTVWGRHLYAAGGNEKAAQYSGISVRSIRLVIYTFSGVMAAVSGITLAARSYSGNPIFGNGAEMDAIAACVLGGIGMGGGYGYIGSTLIGALIIGVLNNGLNLMGIDSFWQTILKGIVILAAVYIDSLKSMRTAKGKEKK